MPKSDNDEENIFIPPDVPRRAISRSPVQINLEGLNTSETSLTGKIVVGVAIGLITMAVGFIGGATWSHNARITALETNQVRDEKDHDKLSQRVDNLETRISK